MVMPNGNGLAKRGRKPSFALSIYAELRPIPQGYGARSATPIFFDKKIFSWQVGENY